MPYHIKIANEDLMKYIQATLMGDIKKAEAYRAFIDPLIKDVYSAIKRLENRDDFNELMQQIVDTDDRAAKKSMMRVRRKYMAMTEKTLDTASSLLDDAEDPTSKAQAVRLANETFGAMGIIAAADPNRADKQGVIDKKSHIL